MAKKPGGKFKHYDPLNSPPTLAPGQLYDPRHDYVRKQGNGGLTGLQKTMAQQDPSGYFLRSMADTGAPIGATTHTPFATWMRENAAGAFTDAFGQANQDNPMLNPRDFMMGQASSAAGLPEFTAPTTVKPRNAEDWVSKHPLGTRQHFNPLLNQVTLDPNAKGNIPDVGSRKWFKQASGAFEANPYEVPALGAGARSFWTDEFNRQTGRQRGVNPAYQGGTSRWSVF